MYIHTKTHMNIHTYVHTYINTCTYINTYIVHTYVHTYVRTHIHAYLHIYIHWQKIMAGGAEMWLKFAFIVEVYINRSVLIFPHLFLISAESGIYFSATFKTVFKLNFKFH